ncbi:hypothetical protein FO519_008882 [Halicephalobus sp. NKZ332]|nr:hypothetical protein FO519_008882 [Halicephalobus sp. NKZ332]
MVSVRGATWGVVLIELVLSTALLIASIAVASAQAQSVSLEGEQQYPSASVLVTCLLSFCLMTSSIFSMFGLSSHKPGFLLSHIFFSIVVSIFHGILTARWLVEWTQIGIIDGDWLISLSGAVLFQACLLTAVYLEIRCYRFMT